MKLTLPQKQIYKMEQFVGASSVSVACGSAISDRLYDVNKIKNAINEVYRINEALRIRISLDTKEPEQYVNEYEYREIEVLEFSSKEEVYKYCEKEAGVPIDLAGELCELKVISSESFCGVFYKLHHIVSDAWAISLLQSQIYKILNNEPVEACSYSDYCIEEEKYLSSKRAQKDKEFFIDQCDKVDEFTYLCDTPPEIGKASRKEFIIDKDVTQKIKDFANEENTSNYTVFLTLISSYINKIKNNVEKFFVGTIVLNRTTSNQQNTVGMFVNDVPYLAELSTEKSFYENLNRAQENVFRLFRHQKCNYVSAIEGTGKSKLFDVLFSYQNCIVYGESVESKWYNPGIQAEALRIHIDDRDSNGVFNVTYDYQIDKFTEEDIDNLHQRLMTLLCDAIENPDKPLYELEYLTEEEKEKVIISFNDTALEYPKDKGVYELFEEQAEKTPDKLAVVFKDKKMTYSQLNDKVSECADKLCSLNIKAKDIVAVHLERSHELIVFQLAILKIGAIFLPVDKRYPVDRIQQMCINCDVKLLISDELDKSAVKADTISLIDFNLIATTTNADTVKNLEDCYIIYTSGSTGTPKGCMLTGKGLLNFCLNNNTLETLDEIENPIFACVNSASFDYFIAETLLPLTNGFAVVLLDDNESTNQKLFLSIVDKNKINVIMTTPTRLNIYYNDKENCDALKGVSCICTSGEPLTSDLLEKMYKKSPEAQVYNPIGPSECSVWDMGGRLERADGLDIHIGKPIANAQIYIVDKYLKPTPIGVTGEICIAGDGVGSGYLNQPELTEEKFVDNPFGTGKLYKSGDLGYWRNDGNICFIGRNDFQVKIRGLRIELGEIENAISEVDGVVQCAVIVRKDSEDRQYICAFYTGEEIDARIMRAELSVKLPKYMIPHVFTHLEEMPLTSSGKISRNTLPTIDFNSITTEAEYVTPETEEEKALAEAIEEVLGTEKVSMEDNFFNVGGDSISAIYIVSVLEEMGYELHVADIMQSETLADVAKAMKVTGAKAIYDQYEVNGFIPFTPIMRAFLKEEKEISKDFVHTCIIPANCDEVTVKRAINILVSHHDMLRGRFAEDGIEICPSNEREAFSFESITIDDTDKAKELLIKTTLSEEKLMKAVFCKTEKENLVCFTVHHFLIDLISWEVLMKDFNIVIQQIKNDEKVTLPAKTASFKLWNEKLKEYFETMPEENRTYWNNINERLDNAKTFASYKEENEAEKYNFTLTKETSDKLINEVNSKYGTRTNEVLLTAVGLAAGKHADGNVGIMVESHGRTELHKPIALERTIGWFTSCYPVVINNTDNIAEELINTKETMRRIPKNGVEYLLLNDGFHKNTEILFNFYKTSLTEDNLSFGGTSVFPGVINVNCFAIDGIVTVNIDVPETHHKANIGEELGLEIRKQIEKIIEICTNTEKQVKTRSDFSDDELAENELDELMDLFDWGEDDE